MRWAFRALHDRANRDTEPELPLARDDRTRPGPNTSETLGSGTSDGLSFWARATGTSIGRMGFDMLKAEFGGILPVRMGDDALYHGALDDALDGDAVVVAVFAPGDVQIGFDGSTLLVIDGSALGRLNPSGIRVVVQRIPFARLPPVPAAGVTWMPSCSM